MTAKLFKITNLPFECPVEQEIRSNSAWVGLVSGVKAQHMLKVTDAPYTYVLREGESSSDYYVTFVHPSGRIFHQPFSIITTAIGWYWGNTGAGPISLETRLDDILYIIMHCEKGECHPLEI